MEKENQSVERVFTTFEKNKIVEKLVTARIGLLFRHPFFGNLATRLTLVDASDWCKTLATDGRHFYYNNSFVNKLTPRQAEFGFAHEILHLVFDHLGRQGSRNKKLSNIAADYAVNQICVDDKIGEVPKFINIYQDNKYRGWSYEQIYEDIEKNCITINIDDLGELLDEHLDGDSNSGELGDEEKNGKPRLTAEQRKQIRDEIKEAIIAAAQSVAAGKLPASIARLIKDLTEPKMDWRQMLRMNIQSLIKNDFSFSRPNRRSQHSGAVLPGLIVQDTVDVCISFDMSGSITTEMAKEMISEVKGLMEEFKDFNLKLWCFDTQVYNMQEFTGDTADDLLDYKIRGGGGTAFECNWEFMKKQGIEPKKFVMFTDGYPGDSWGDPDYCDTLFIIHGNNTIVSPFGQTAYYK